MESSARSSHLIANRRPRRLGRAGGGFRRRPGWASLISLSLIAIGAFAVSAGTPTLALRAPGPDGAPPSPTSNACSIDLANGLVDAYWGTLSDSSEGSATDPDEPGIPNQVDFLLSRICNSSTWLFLWAYVASPTPVRNGFHFYLETTGDGMADHDLLVNMSGVVELWSNSGAWNQIGLPATDRIDFTGGPPTMEMGIELALIGSPETVRYYVTTEPDAVPDGANIDRIMDAGWTGPYAVPESTAWSALATIGLVVPTLLRFRGRGGARPARSIRAVR